MDSERRHELETNDLREFLDNFKDFWDKHGNRMLITLIVVLGAWLGWSKYKQWQAEKTESAYTELNNVDSAEKFRTLAGERSAVHDEAMRRGGDTALGDARRALIVDDEEKAAAALKGAGSAYQALVDRGATVEYQLAGHEGLAKVALMREEWDKAGKHYEQIIELAGESFLVQADRAKRALDRIDLLKSPVAFGPEIESVPIDFPSPSDQPVDESGGTEGTLPELPLPVPLPENE